MNGGSPVQMALEFKHKTCGRNGKKMISRFFLFFFSHFIRPQFHVESSLYFLLLLKFFYEKGKMMSGKTVVSVFIAWKNATVTVRCVVLIRR